jgi:hypothetical protein
MAKKYKLTGCAKFFIFFIIAAPLAWIGASYYNGQNPIQEVKEFVQSIIGNESPDQNDVADTTTIDQNGVNSSLNGNGSVFQEMELKELEIKNLKNDLKDCEALNDKLKQLIETQKLEIKNLTQRLEAQE